MRTTTEEEWRKTTRKTRYVSPVSHSSEEREMEEVPPSPVQLTFNPGDVIQDFSIPFMKILYTSQRGLRCDSCFEAGTSLRRCTSCKQVFYCSKTCQVADWKTAHKVECSLAYFRTESGSFFSPSTIDFKFRLLRLFSLLKLHPQLAQKPFKIYDGTSRSLNDLLTSQDEVEEDGDVHDYCSDIASNLLSEEILGLNSTDVDPLLHYFLKLSGLCRTNAFSIYTNERTEAVGAAVYIETSAFHHSCKPTAFFLIKGLRIQVRAIASIEPTHKPLISYISTQKNRAERRELLRQRYNFNCQCDQCEHGEDSEINSVRMTQLIQSTSTFDETTQWTTVLKVHRQLLPLLRKIYSEYDERITLQFYSTFTQLLKMSQRQSDDDGGGGDAVLANSLSDISTDTSAHLLITYGPEHETVQEFRDLMSSLYSSK